MAESPSSLAKSEARPALGSWPPPSRSEVQYRPLGPLLSDSASRAFLGLRIAGGAAGPCALVWVPDSIAREPEKLVSLSRETKRASALEHQNIVQVFGLVELDEGLARAVEYADAESLRCILDVAVRLPPPVAARVILDAAVGVQYAHLVGDAHGAPLIHSELRPETVFVSYSGATKVAGYGAHALAPQAADSRAAGRQRHRAPEQILGGQSAVSEQTDVYLLGALLYQTLTGEAPFQGEANYDAAVVGKVPALLHSDLVPSALRDVLSKAMAKKRERRFASVHEFREALEQAAGVVADRSAVADFVEGLFADDDHRVTRKREIDDGIREWSAEMARAAPSPAPSPPPLPRSLSTRSPPSAPTARSPAALPRAPEPKLARPPQPGSRRPSVGDRGAAGAHERGSRRWGLAAIPVAAVAAGALLVGMSGGLLRWKQPGASGSRAAIEAQAAPPEQAGAGAPSSSLPSAKQQAAPGANGAPPERETSGTAAAAPPVPSGLGGPPTMPSGPDPGARLARAADAEPGADRPLASERRGTVALDAPSGCEVRIDGRSVGRTPLRGPISVSEGRHHIQARLGSSVWKKKFSIHDRERLLLEAKLHARGRR